MASIAEIRAELIAYLDAQANEAAQVLNALNAWHIYIPRSSTGKRKDVKRGGENEWFFLLRQGEQLRLWRNWISADGIRPDALIDDASGLAFDQVITEWLRATRIVDLAISITKSGQIPKGMASYGGVDLDELFSGAPYSVSDALGDSAQRYADSLEGDELARDLEARRTDLAKRAGAKTERSATKADLAGLARLEAIASQLAEIQAERDVLLVELLASHPLRIVAASAGCAPQTVANIARKMASAPAFEEVPF